MHLSQPNFYENLIIKSSFTGITLLKQYSYGRRYCGSQLYNVSINGKEVITKKQEKLDWPGKDDMKQKKTPVKTGEQLNVHISSRDKINKKEGKKQYSINKNICRKRLMTFVCSLPPDKREFYFWTISFPYQIPDNTAYKLLNIWLPRLRNFTMSKHCIWVAERKTKNTIHFHLGISNKMDVHRANVLMRIALRNARQRNELTEPYHKLKKYNGVDIDKEKIKVNGKWIRTKKVQNYAGKKERKALIYYLTKYITKNDIKFERLAWHNSRGFSAIFTGITFTQHEFVSKYKFKDLINKKSSFSNEFYQFHSWLAEPPPFIIEHFINVNSLILSKLN